MPICSFDYMLPTFTRRMVPVMYYFVLLRCCERIFICKIKNFSLWSCKLLELYMLCCVMSSGSVFIEKNRHPVWHLQVRRCQYVSCALCHTASTSSSTSNVHNFDGPVTWSVSLVIYDQLKTVADHEAAKEKGTKMCWSPDPFSVTHGKSQQWIAPCRTSSRNVDKYSKMKNAAEEWPVSAGSYDHLRLHHQSSAVCVARQPTQSPNDPQLTWDTIRHLTAHSIFYINKIINLLQLDLFETCDRFHVFLNYVGVMLSNKQSSAGRFETYLKLMTVFMFFLLNDLHVSSRHKYRLVRVYLVVAINEI